MTKILRAILCGWILLVFAAASGTAGAAPEKAVQQCQKLKDRIEHYDQLRRKGGSGPQMDSWKRTRRDLEKQFRDLGCRHYRWELK
jgi:hypothetical protein